MYFYYQFLTVDRDTPGNSDDLGRNPSIEDTHREAILEQPPVNPLTMEMEVSTTGSLLISCHKQLSFKLRVTGAVTVFYEAHFCKMMELDVDSERAFCCVYGTDTHCT